MVHKNDGTQEKDESRPPTLEDLVNLALALNQSCAEYIIIGGMAMIQQGFVRATEDIDLLVRTTHENEAKVIKALMSLPDQAVQEIQPGDLDQYEVIRIADEIVVDLMKSACGIDYDKAKKGIVMVDIQGVTIPFAGADLLLQLKQSIRPKDQLDADFLRAKIKSHKNG